MDKQFIKAFIQEYSRYSSIYLCSYIQSSIEDDDEFDKDKLNQLLDIVKNIEQAENVGINKFLFNNGFMSIDIPYIDEDICKEIKVKHNKSYNNIAKESRIKWLRSLITE